jgi:rubrerythrin
MLRLEKKDLDRLEREAKTGRERFATPVLREELLALVREVRRLRRSHQAVKHTIVCETCGWACYLEDEHPTECPVCNPKPWEG